MPTVIKKAGRAIERLIGADVREGEWRLVLLFFASICPALPPVGNLSPHDTA